MEIWTWKNPKSKITNTELGLSKSKSYTLSRRSSVEAKEENFEALAMNNE